MIIIGIGLLLFVVAGNKGNTEAINLLNSFCNNCIIEYYGEDKGYGIKANKNIVHGETLFKLPFKYMITSFDYYPWTTYFENSDQSFKLIPRLIYEKYVNPVYSPLKSLIDFYPKYYNGFYNMTEKNLQYFYSTFGENMKFESPIDCKVAKGYYFMKARKIPDIEKCSECLNDDVFMWACQAVLTRAFNFHKVNYYKLALHQNLPKEQNVPGSVLLPGIDVFNHYPRKINNNAISVRYDIQYAENPPQAIAKSDRNTVKGEEIYISYGPKTNFELAILHGFILENNSDDLQFIAVLSNINNCQNYEPVQKYCPFAIKKSVLNYEIINYLYNKITQKNTEIKDIYKEINDINNYQEMNNFRLVFQGYRNSIVTYKIYKCRKDFRESLKLVKSQEGKDYYEKLVDKLCYLSNLDSFKHLKVVDRVLLKGLYERVFS
ncbi:hypothetical protein SteCoe_2308 [Stentor coeruleus]|uniref:SET domain-containing protein n=1 Tax=Stentor coeruleus TaxID=5963 RepID=A0A1R2CZT7_9CILI|nr:hypothetical protein SteCoe_2308 [Stentor coeruleus]